MTDVERAWLDRNDPASGIARITVAQAESLSRRGVFSDGMIPKIEAALAAVRGGVKQAFISGAGSGAVVAVLCGAGTEIVA